MQKNRTKRRHTILFTVYAAVAVSLSLVIALGETASGSTAGTAGKYADSGHSTVFWDNTFTAAQYQKNWKPRGKGVRMGGINIDQTLSVSDGVLYIRPYTDGTSIFTGSMRTASTMPIQFGTVSVEMKVCLASGLRGAAWLQSSQNRGNESGTGAGTEIDIVEIVPGARTYVGNNLHWGGYKKYHQHRGQRLSVDRPCDWHKYDVTWTPQEYQFSVDGHVTWRTSEGISQAEEYLILSVEAPKTMKEPVRSALLNAINPKDLGYIAVRKATWSPLNP